MSKDSIYENEYNEYEEFKDEFNGSKNKILLHLSMASVIILLICFYITKSFIYGYIGHVLIMTGLWSMVYVEDLWKELSIKVRFIAIPFSLILLCSGFALIGLKAYALFQGY